MIEMVILTTILAILFLFVSILSWKHKVVEGVIIYLILSVGLGFCSYLEYDNMVTIQEYTVLEKVTITENENVKVHYIIKDEEGNKYITTKNVTLKVGEKIELKKEEMNKKYKIVKFEKGE